ncbi:MAG TPA: SDR family NAD(P)-dependent oxidoreductase [Symbiobacteriaceae bacterium]|jgi:NAD(P)-dependent dehydrogenase (short-subunit alcohol dehydrogenase family)
MAVVVITGASSGIGEATARLLAREGHKLALAARRVERLEALAAELAGLTDVLVVRADVAQPADLEDLARQAGERFGAIDVWINNAGIGNGPPWYEQDPAAIARVIDTNLTGPILGARAALPWMRKQGSGLIINIGSVAGSIGTAGVYSATKFGLRGFSESLRREVARFGVKVAHVSPGFIRTEMTASVRMRMPSADVAARVIARLIRRPKREVVVPGWYRMLIALNRISPALVDWVQIKFLQGKVNME